MVSQILGAWALNIGDVSAEIRVIGPKKIWGRKFFPGEVLHRIMPTISLRQASLGEILNSRPEIERMLDDDGA
jgi:hypothetical protein